MYLFLFWGWQTIRFFNLASSNQTELAGFTLVDGKIHLFFYYMFCASSVIFLPSFERHGLVVDGVQEEVMDNFLRKKNTPGHVFLNYLCTSSSSWGGTLKRESWEIWYLLHKKIMRGRESETDKRLPLHLILFCSPSLKSLSSSSPTTSRGLMKALPLFRGSRATRTKVASVHLGTGKERFQIDSDKTGYCPK